MAMTQTSSGPPLPPWLEGGGGASRGRARGGLRQLRGPALLAVGVALGWLLHARRPAPTAAVAAPAAIAEAARCPAPVPCGGGSPPARGPAHASHTRPKPAARSGSLLPLPAEGPLTDDARRDALRAFAQKKADDLRSCLGDPGRGPLRRVGAALEIDARGAVAAVQILGGDSGNRSVESCYSARLRAWRFPQALLQGDERLLVNFVL